MKSSLRFGLVIASIGLVSSACGQPFVSFTGSSTSGSGGAMAGTGGAMAGTGGGSSGSAGTAGGGPTASSASSGASGGSSSASAGTTTSSASSSGGVDGGILGPTVQILHPGSDPRKKGVSIYFHGIATDPTDGVLSGNALVWTDSLEGQFGTGDPVMWAPTMVGAHVITLTATDSANYSATASIMFAVIP